jgi:hypothetical protein
MKIENTCYVLANEIDGETIYLTSEYFFDNDIRKASRFKTSTVAMYTKSFIYQKYKCELNVVELKITYEWQ